MEASPHSAGEPWPASARGWAALLILLAVAVWLHLFRIASLPRGLFMDEAAIGYNAFSIASRGVDEHGEPWPLFFKSFGDYKNPLYIYLTALVYKLFGYSLWTTRATSALCWLTGTVFLMLLGRRMFSDARTQLYLLLCASFTPWLFSLSRISFEVIVLYPLLTLHLLAVYRAYQEDSPGWAPLAGLSVGLMVYAYSAFRLLAPVHAAAVVLCYPGRPYWRTHAPYLATAAVTAAPYAAYLSGHLAALTVRFKSITFLNDWRLSTPAKLKLFGKHYGSYLSPDFLVLSGDPNRRHHTGYGGELLAVTGLLLLLGLAAKLETGALWKHPFHRFLLIGLLIGPVAASLTVEEHHSLRAFSMVVFALLLSAIGMDVLAQRPSKLLPALALIATAASSFLYLRDYFTRFSAESIAAFENFGFRETLQAAVDQAQTKVVVSPEGGQVYIQLLYFRPLVANPRRVAIELGSRAEIAPGDTFIRYDPTGRMAQSRVGLPEGSLYGWLPYGQATRHFRRQDRAGPRD